MHHGMCLGVFNGTTPPQPPSEYHIFAFPTYGDPCWGGWTILRVMWPHTMLPEADHALCRCIVDVNAPLHLPWGMATATHHFNYPLNNRCLHTEATVTTDPCLAGWTILRVMWQHPFLPGAAQALYKCIVDVNVPWHVPWGTTKVPHHFNHHLNTRF